ncbi:MAG: ABC transporter permease [Clostridium sp.]
MNNKPKRVKTIMAIVKKDFTEMFRYKDWIIPIFIWPLIFPLLYIFSSMGLAGPDGSSLGNFKELTGTDNYMAFLMVGTMIYMWVNLTMWNYGTFLRNEQRKGTLESVWLCPINKFDLLIGGAGASIMMGMIYLGIALVEYQLIYGVHFYGNLFLWILLFLSVIPGVVGIGMVFASLVLWLKEVNVAVMLARGLVMIFCGISFPIEVMPSWMEVISKIFPFTFAIDAARDVMVKGIPFLDVLPKILICLLIGAFYITLGRIIFSKVERKVKNEGSLERF